MDEPRFGNNGVDVMRPMDPGMLPPRFVTRNEMNVSMDRSTSLRADVDYTVIARFWPHQTLTHHSRTASPQHRERIPSVWRICS